MKAYTFVGMELNKRSRDEKSKVLQTIKNNNPVKTEKAYKSKKAERGRSQENRNLAHKISKNMSKINPNDKPKGQAFFFGEKDWSWKER